MSSNALEPPTDADLLSAFFDGVVNQFRTEVRVALVRRQADLGLSGNEVADRLGVAKSTFSGLRSHGIERLSTLVRLMLALEIDELAQLAVSPFTRLTPYGWLAALRSLAPAADLALEDVELLRELVMCEEWPRALAQNDSDRLAALARQFAQTVSVRLNLPVVPRSIAFLRQLAENWGDAYFLCLDAIPIGSEGPP